MTSCGSNSRIAARSCSSEARYCTCTPCASSQSRSASAPVGARAGGADIAHVGAALDEQARHQQLGSLVTRHGDAAIDAVQRQLVADRVEHAAPWPGRSRAGRRRRHHRPTGARHRCPRRPPVPIPRWDGPPARIPGRTRCRTGVPPPPRRSPVRRRGHAIRASAPMGPPRGRAARASCPHRPGRPGTSRPPASPSGAPAVRRAGSCTGPCSASCRA